MNLYDNGLCVYLLFGSSALPSSRREKRGEESLQTFVITSSDSDGYIRIYINRSLFGLFTL